MAAGSLLESASVGWCVTQTNRNGLGGKTERGGKKDPGEPWIHSQRQSPGNGGRVGGGGLLLAHCCRTKRESGETGTKELGGLAALL